MTHTVQAYSNDTETIRYGIIANGEMIRKNFKTWDNAAKAAKKMNDEFKVETEHEVVIEDAPTSEHVEASQEAQPSAEQNFTNMSTKALAWFNGFITQASETEAKINTRTAIAAAIANEEAIFETGIQHNSEYFRLSQDGVYAEIILLTNPKYGDETFILQPERGKTNGKRDGMGHNQKATVETLHKLLKPHVAQELEARGWRWCGFESKYGYDMYCKPVQKSPTPEPTPEPDPTVTVEASQEAQPTPEQFQFNIGMFFQAVYDYCYTQVSDYLPQPHDYLYGSPNRPMSTTWARIEGAHYIQVDRRTEGVYTWVAVPYQLSLKVMEDYELTFIKAPEALQIAWNDLRSVPYVERSLEHKHGTCDQCGHPDTFFYPLRLDGCTEWYCGACFELHVICHAQRAVDQYEDENYQEGNLQPVKL